MIGNCIQLLLIINFGVYLRVAKTATHSLHINHVSSNEFCADVTM